jgi:hypothetical protein
MNLRAVIYGRETRSPTVREEYNMGYIKKLHEL